MRKLLIILFLFILSGQLFAQGELCFPYKNENEKWLLIKSDGSPLNSIEYDTVSIKNLYRYQIIKVKLSGKWGVINSVGDQILPIAYDSIDYNNLGWLSHAYILVANKTAKNQNCYGLFSASGEEILPIHFNKIKFVFQKHILLDYGTPIAAQSLDSNKLNNWGLYNFKGEQLLSHEYSEIQSLICNNYDKTEKSRCVYLSKINEEKETINGLFNTSNKKWIVPCLQPISRNYFSNSEHVSLGNTSSCQLLTEGEYFTFPIEYQKINDYKSIPVLGFYNMQGSLIYQWLDTVNRVYGTRTFYYIHNDTVVGKTSVPKIEPICDSTSLKLLSFGNTHALFDLNKGLLVKPGMYKKHYEPDCKEEYISLLKIADNTTIAFDFEGGIWQPEPPKITSETRYYNGSLLVRDKDNQIIHMSPYIVQKPIKPLKKYGDCYIAKYDGKTGIINKDKKILEPFIYDYIEDDQYEGFYMFKTGPKTVLMDSNLNKVVSSKKLHWGSMDWNDGFFETMASKKKYKIFNKETRKFILKNAHMPTKIDRDSLHYYNGHSDIYNSMHEINDSVRLVQAFDTRTGWTLYDELGNKIAGTSTKTYRQIRPIESEGKLIGYIYPNAAEVITPYAGNYNQSNSYFFYGGLRFENMDTVHSIYYNSRNKTYSAKHNYYKYIFDENGKFINKYTKIDEIDNGLFKVLIDYKWNLCDSNFQELLPEFYVKIEGQNPYFTATQIIDKKQSIQIVFLGDKVNISNKYIRVKRIGRYCFGYLTEKTFDILNTKAELLYKGGNQLIINNDYIVFIADGIEYWMTPRGDMIYASHKITQ